MSKLENSQEDSFQDIYQFMYYEMESHRLEVILVPSRIPESAKDGCMIRVAVDQNPGWYRDLCALYKVSSRRKKPRTKVHRQEILRVLTRLIEGKITRSKYYTYLRNTAQKINEECSGIEFYNEYGVFPEPWNDQF